MKMEKAYRASKVKATFMQVGRELEAPSTAGNQDPLRAKFSCGMISRSVVSALNLQFLSPICRLVTAITRSITLLYTVTLLSLLTRIQLNLLGRRNYLSSVVSLASQPQHDSTISLENHDNDNIERAYGNDFETNRKYLTFSWWLLHRGWKEVMVDVEDAVKKVFGSVNPREDIPLERISSLMLDVRKIVEGATPEERK